MSIRNFLALSALLSLGTLPQAASALPLDNPSFEPGITSWHSSNNQFAAAPDNRSFSGASFSYFNVNSGTFWQIVSTNPDDTGSQLQLQPNTVYTLTGYGMSGQDARLTTIDIRGSASPSTAQGPLLASEVFQVEPITAPRFGYELAPDGVTYWQRMTVTLDTRAAPTLVGKYLAVGATSQGNSSFSTNFDHFSVAAAPAGNAYALPVHNPTFESRDSSHNPLAWQGSLKSYEETRALHGSRFGALDGGAHVTGQLVSLNPNDAGSQLRFLADTIYTLTAYGMTGGDPRDAVISILGDADAGALGDSVLATGTFTILANGGNGTYVLAPDGVTLWREMRVVLDTSLFPAAVGQFMSFSLTSPETNAFSPNFDNFTLTAQVIPEPGSIVAVGLVALVVMRR